MGKRQALAEFHRGSILAAAERLFAEKGTDGTTMDDIARESEYSKATLYVYFQSKEEIVGAILLNGLTMLKKRVSEAIRRHEDWREAYGAVCAAILSFYEENPAAYEAVVGGSRSGVENTGDVHRKVHEVCQELSDFLKRGEDEGAVAPGQDHRELVMLFWASISGVIHMADCRASFVKEETERDRETFLKDGFELFLRAMTKK